jgi:mono/diheme cytochrome c family protein
MKQIKVFFIVTLVLAALFSGCLQGSETVEKKLVPVPYPETAKSIVNPVTKTDANLDVGKDKYEIFCSMCHGLSGSGGEEVSKNFQIDPSSLVSSGVKRRTDGELFWATKNGVNKTKMLPWGELLSDEEIWLIVNHIRVLQKEA